MQAEKLGHESIDRAVVDLVGRADLLQPRPVAGAAAELARAEALAIKDFEVIGETG